MRSRRTRGVACLPRATDHRLAIVRLDPLPSSHIVYWLVCVCGCQVGYGTDPSLGDYWLVRNSWTANWGESGYIRLHRGSATNPVCGVDTQPADGSGCDGGPTSVQVYVWQRGCEAVCMQI